MKQRLLHIMMGKGNPDMQRGLESVFECRHIDWTETKFPEPYQPELAHQQPTMNRIHLAHGFDVRNPSGEARLENRLPVAGRGASIKKEVGPFDDIVLGTFREFKPDVVFLHLQRPGILAKSSIDEMNQTAKLVNWCGDVREELPGHYIDLGDHIAMTLFTNMEDVEKLRKEGVKADFLQVGFDSQNFNPEGPVAAYPEIIFMGSNYGYQYPLSSYRESMVKTLKSVFGDKFGVYGANWGNLANGLITDYGSEGQAYRSCKIAISLSHFERSKYASDRLFRILGSGAFCLTHVFPDLEHDFEIGQDLDVFNSIDELVTKIKYYLEHEELRKRIAIEGCRRARQNFTWHHFAENLKTITDELMKDVRNPSGEPRIDSRMTTTTNYHKDPSNPSNGPQWENRIDDNGVKKVYFDIGCNIGGYAFAWVGNRNNMVYAFEPEPGLYGALKAKESVYPNFKVFPYALSQEDGRATFFVGDNLCTSSLKEFVPGAAFTTKEAIEVETKRLDTFCEEHGITEIEHLKCDAQGSDLDVIKSLGEKVHNVKTIVIEAFLTPKTEEIYVDEVKDFEVIEYLGSKGFKCVGKAVDGNYADLTFVK